MLVLFVPTLVLLPYNQLRADELLKALVAEQYLRQALDRAERAEALLDAAEHDLLMLLQNTTLHRVALGDQRAEAQAASAFGRFLDRAGGRYSGLCLLSPQGEERLCVRREDGRVAQTPPEQLVDRAAEPFVAGVLRARADPSALPIAVAPPTRLQPGGLQVLRYAAPLPGPTNETRAVMVLELPLAPLFEELRNPEPAVETLLIDRHGTYLLSPAGLPGASPGTLEQHQPTDAATILSQSSGVIIDSPDRAGRLQAYARIWPHGLEDTQWTVIYTWPLTSVFNYLGELRMVTLLIAVVALIVALLLAHLLSRAILRPIKALAAAAERVGAGDLHAPIPQVGGGEIGALARTLDHTVARLRETIELAERRRHEAETLRAATQALSSTISTECVLELILTELRKVVPFDSASVQSVHDGVAEIIGAYGLANVQALIGRCFPLAPGASPNADVAATRAPVILTDAPTRYQAFREFPFVDDPIRSWLGMPLIFGERLIGMITLDKFEPGFYTSEHARLAGAFADQAAIALEHARLFAEAQRELADRRRAEAAHGRLAAVIEATTDFVAMCDPRGQLIYINRAGRALVGLPEDADVTTSTVYDLVAPAAAERLRESAAEAAATGTWTGEVLLRSRDGSEIPASQVIIAHYGVDGRPEYYSTVVRDMRERRRAEEELRQAQKMEALGRLAGGLAHDFNNLLTVVLGECDLILDELPSDHALRTSIEQIRQSGARAAALTSQLLAFSRRQVLQPELIDLNDVISGTEGILRRLIGEDIALTIVRAHDLPTVRADPGQLEQVVLNLALNARDAMPEGGRLTIETAMARIRADDGTEHKDLAPGAYAKLTVTDTGIGIDPEAAAHIFEPFFTTKPRGKGTGLGLASVHGIVRQSGGQISFSTGPGQGTSFTVLLPAAEGSAPPTPGAPPRPATRPQPRTILLVEDDDPVRAMTRQILRRAGFTVLEASDGVTARELAASYPDAIHAVLTDVVMPGGVNGVQLAATLRATRPGIGVVYMSGYTDNALVGHSLADDGARFIQKPFAPDDLVAVLSEILARTGHGAS